MAGKLPCEKSASLTSLPVHMICSWTIQSSMSFSWFWHSTNGNAAWWLNSKEPTGQYRRRGSNPWVGKIPWRRNWGDPMDRGAWRATVHGVARVWHDWATEQQQQNCRHRPQGVSLLEILALPWAAVNKEGQMHWCVEEWDIPGSQRGEWLGSEAPRQGQGIGHLCFVGSRQEKNRDGIAQTGNNLIHTSRWMVISI